MFVVFAPVDKLLYTSAPCPAPAGLLVTRSSPRSFLSVVALHVACLPSQCFSSWWVAGSFISAKSCLPVFPPPMVTFPYAQQQAASLLFLLDSVLPRPSPSSCRSPLCWAPALSSPSPSSSLPSRFSSGKTSNLITPLSGYSILCLCQSNSLLLRNIETVPTGLALNVYPQTSKHSTPLAVQTWVNSLPICIFSLEHARTSYFMEKMGGITWEITYPSILLFPIFC